MVEFVGQINNPMQLIDDVHRYEDQIQLRVNKKPDPHFLQFLTAFKTNAGAVDYWMGVSFLVHEPSKIMYLKGISLYWCAANAGNSSDPMACLKQDSKLIDGRITFVTVGSAKPTANQPIDYSILSDYVLEKGYLYQWYSTTNENAWNMLQDFTDRDDFNYDWEDLGASGVWTSRERMQKPIRKVIASVPNQYTFTYDYHYDPLEDTSDEIVDTNNDGIPDSDEDLAYGKADESFPITKNAHLDYVDGRAFYVPNGWRPSVFWTRYLQKRDDNQYRVFVIEPTFLMTSLMIRIAVPARLFSTYETNSTYPPISHEELRELCNSNAGDIEMSVITPLATKSGDYVGAYTKLGSLGNITNMVDPYHYLASMLMRM